jgi:hypothetical protein
MERGRQILRLMLCLGGGVVCFALMAGFAVVAKEFLAGGAGAQLGLVAVSGWGVLIGMVGLAGFILAGFFCFAVGVVLVAEGVVRGNREERRW